MNDRVRRWRSATVRIRTGCAGAALFAAKKWFRTAITSAGKATSSSGSAGRLSVRRPRATTAASSEAVFCYNGLGHVTDAAGDEPLGAGGSLPGSGRTGGSASGGDRPGTERRLVGGALGRGRRGA